MISQAEPGGVLESEAHQRGSVEVPVGERRRT